MLKNRLTLTSRPDTIIPSIFVKRLDHSTVFSLSRYAGKCTVHMQRTRHRQTFTTPQANIYHGSCNYRLKTQYKLLRSLKLEGHFHVFNCSLSQIILHKTFTLEKAKINKRICD